MRFRDRIALLAVATLAVSACTGAASPSPSATATPTSATSAAPASPTGIPLPSEYVVGLITALTGPTSSQDYGISLRNAAEMAIDEINAAGGVGGVPIRAVFDDHQGTAQAAVPAFQKLIGVDQVPVVFTSGTGPTKAIAPIATENHILLINCCARSHTLVDAGEYVFTSRPYDTAEETIFMKYLVAQGYSKVAMIHNATEPGRASRSLVESLAPQVGFELVDVEEYPEGTTDFSSYIAKIKASGADVLYMNTFGTDVGSIILQARQFGLTIPITSYGSALDPAVLSVAGAAAEGMLISSQVNWDPASQPEQQAFSDRFEARYGVAPAGFSALEYDAVRYILPAIIAYTQEHNLPYNGDSLREAITAIKSFEGVMTGACTFEIARDCAKDMAIYTVQNGAFKVLEVAKR